MSALSWVSALVFIVYPLMGINIGVEASHWPEGLVLGSVWQGMLWFSKNPDTFAHLFGFGSHPLLFMFAFYSLFAPLSGILFARRQPVPASLGPTNPAPPPSTGPPSSTLP